MRKSKKEIMDITTSLYTGRLIRLTIIEMKNVDTLVFRLNFNGCAARRVIEAVWPRGWPVGANL